MPIKVLVVDDSFLMRTLIADILNADPEIEVIGTAKSGPETVEKLRKLKPDVITLDLVMPEWDGLTTLRHIMTDTPVPVIIVSAHSKDGAEVTLQCLRAGAIGFVVKPTGELSLDIERIKLQLAAMVKAAAEVDIGKIKLLVAGPKTARREPPNGYIVVIGASTGGLYPLEEILAALPADFPSPVIVAQHMPARVFTDTLAERLQRNCQLAVKVPEDGERIQPRKVYIAPAGCYMTVEPQRSDKGQRVKEVTACFSKTELNGVITPSIDVTMQSVASVYQEGVCGIILSGMGHDGVKGMRAIKQAGGNTIVQDESALISGMPNAVFEAGNADQVLPPAKIVDTLMELGPWARVAL